MSESSKSHPPSAGQGGQGRELIINYVPGDECRVAVVVDGQMDEFHSERADQVSHVGNIYVGRVTNVEPAIQAAFIDFGLESNGFLHGSDVHPRYFPGEDDETTERVGRKTPRRERPPIQACFKRGQEVIVQVLKEGVGSKGPTLTSYLSIPGRYLVMMPGMDRTGVSRKVEDEDLRARMKAILDQLELPEGFGFILRTAGLDRSKTELKRDLAYLVRLQKDMERRRSAGGGKPRLLYSESDLLLRSLRDMFTSETTRVVIDNEMGLRRAARFMKLVSPRSATRLMQYTGKAPIFNALGIQEQIERIYSREVPLPSGGRLVIDETEALVAIDVNSGKNRDARDAETNALRTNLEAADEIVRQLRLRDLGGIVVNDLIDMRPAKHRQQVEAKFAELMKTDRAKSTLAPIGEFGTLEMTRQRMRGSHESQHFHDCPTCRGRGLIQRPESVAADSLRQAAAVLAHDVVTRVEMVVHPRIAGELLSGRRKALMRLEVASGKTVMVRLSDATPQDRVAFYAYDAQGNDIELERLPRIKATDETLKPYEDPEPSADIIDDEEPLEPLLVDKVEEAVDLLEPHMSEQPAGTVDMSAPDLQLTTDRRGGRGGRGRRGGRNRRGKGGEGGPEQEPAIQGGRAAPTITGPTMAVDQSREHPTLVVVGDGTHAPRADGAGAPIPIDGHDGGAGSGEVRLGLDGQPLPGDGRRRRRRRRRGRGGSGGGGPEGQGQQQGQSQGPQQNQSGQPMPMDAMPASDQQVPGGIPGAQSLPPSRPPAQPAPRTPRPPRPVIAPPGSLAAMFARDAQQESTTQNPQNPQNPSMANIPEPSGTLRPVGDGQDDELDDDGPDDQGAQGGQSAQPGAVRPDGQPLVGPNGEGGEGGRRRRRRRGRGGRGGRGGGGGGQPPQGQQGQQGGQGGPSGQQGGQGGQRGGGGGGQQRPPQQPSMRPPMPPQAAPMPAPMPKPVVTPAASKPPAVAGPKRLYAAFRRLKPGQIPKAGRDE